MRKILFTVILIGLLPISNVWAAQMDVFVANNDQSIKPEFRFLRVIYIEYPNGGQLAEKLAGKEEMISFSVDSTQLKNMINQLNNDLLKRSSPSVVTDMTMDYQAKITGTEKQAVLEYNILVAPIVEGFEVRKGNGDVARIIDSTWRGFEVAVPIMIDTEYGSFDLNSPSSVLNVFSNDAYALIQEKNPESIINQHIFDASGIYAKPLGKWHFLFDPTAIIEESKKMGFNGISVVSHYSLGECTIYGGLCSDRLWIEDIDLDTTYRIRVIESQDDATISIEGYVSEDDILGLEVFGIKLENPNTGPGTDEFPATVIYGMAGVAAIGGGAFFLISNRKLKGETGQGQTGIDPSHLTVYSTSESSGGYHTNRGEAQLNSTEIKTAI